MSNIFREKLNNLQTIIVVLWGTVFLTVYFAFGSSFSKLVGNVLSVFWLICLVILIQFSQTFEKGSPKIKNSMQIHSLGQHMVPIIIAITIIIVINSILFWRGFFEIDTERHALLIPKMLITNIMVVVILGPLYVWWRLHNKHKR